MKWVKEGRGNTKEEDQRSGNGERKKRYIGTGLRGRQRRDWRKRKGNREE